MVVGEGSVVVGEGCASSASSACSTTAASTATLASVPPSSTSSPSEAASSYDGDAVHTGALAARWCDLSEAEGLPLLLPTLGSGGFDLEETEEFLEDESPSKSRRSRRRRRKNLDGKEAKHVDALVALSPSVKQAGCARRGAVTLGDLGFDLGGQSPHGGTSLGQMPARHDSSWQANPYSPCPANAGPLGVVRSLPFTPPHSFPMPMSALSPNLGDASSRTPPNQCQQVYAHYPPVNTHHCYQEFYTPPWGPSLEGYAFQESSYCLRSGEIGGCQAMPLRPDEASGNDTSPMADVLQSWLHAASGGLPPGGDVLAARLQAAVPEAYED